MTFEDQSRIFTSLRFPMAVMVVFIHAYFIVGMSNSEVFSAGITSYLTYACSFVFPCGAVPLFFVISGYYFFYKSDHFNLKTYKSQIHKRIKTLFIPYVSWNIIAILYSLVVHNRNIFHLPAHQILHYFSIEFTRIWFDPNSPILGKMNTPIDLPLWFIRDLMVVMLLSPVIYNILSRKTISLLFIATLLLLSVCSYIPTYLLPGLGLNSLLFFSIGAWYGIRKKNIISTIWDCRFLIVSIYIIFFICDLYIWRPFIQISLIEQLLPELRTVVNFHQFLIITSLPMYLIIAIFLLIKIKSLYRLNSSSFTIYALHYILIFDFFKLSLYVSSNNSSLIFCFYFIVPVIIILLSIIISSTIHKNYFLTKTLLGGR